MAAKTLFNQCVWLVDTIRTTGKITKHELDELWAKCPLNEQKEKVYPLRSFHRHREAVTKLFGLYISCDKFDDNKYYLSDVSDLRDNSLRLQLCNTLSFSNMLLEQPDLQKRVSFQQKETGMEHLSVVLNCMRLKQAVLLTFKKETGLLPTAVFPYSLKEENHQWLLAAKPTDGNSEVQVYWLKDVANTTVTKLKGSMPRWFNSDVFFASWLEMQQPKKKQKSEKPASKKEVAPKKEKAPKAVEPKKTEPKKLEASQSAQLSLF